MAFKDEYEVARLYTNGAFSAQLSETFSSYERLEFHLAPPVFSRKNAQGHMIKRRFGPWMLNAFKLLARFKSLRGTWLDVFGYSAERKMERQLIAGYEDDLAFAAKRLTLENQAQLNELLALPFEIRGFGHVKHQNVTQTKMRHEALMNELKQPINEFVVAAE
ncbi:MAG: DUF6537 domain-containing protein, partial [Notoacmeibacter sp.]